METLFVWGIPLLGSGALGFALGFMSRNSKIDKLSSEIWNLRASARQAEPGTGGAERAPQARSARPAPHRPTVPVRHAAARTAPLPTGISYVIAAEGDVPDDDRPMTDHEYAELMRRRASELA